MHKFDSRTISLIDFQVEFHVFSSMESDISGKEELVYAATRCEELGGYELYIWTHQEGIFPL